MLMVHTPNAANPANTVTLFILRAWAMRIDAASAAAAAVAVA